MGGRCQDIGYFVNTSCKTEDLYLGHLEKAYIKAKREW